MRSFTERQLDQYRSFHRDHRNRLTHIFGIPAIVVAIDVGTAAVRLPGGLTLAELLVAATLLLWLWMDVQLGVALAVPLVLVTWGAHLLAANAPDRVLPVFLVLFVAGWALQFYGHSAFEGKRPAFLSNLFQTLVAPLFLMDEAFRAIGLRH
ncbi:DUF962 domain-containing protein [Roseiterribacter gracilis]|uniref:Mpo1 family 2-hydroxy fatty acid dioxygenase n=1 Tax=Roseiterribacter gracilis TaxID=2812848 RepID=UPI003B43CADA